MAYYGTSVWTLEDPVLGQFELGDQNNVLVENYNIGNPEVRAVPDPNPDVDGEGDLTALSGARLVTLDLRIFGDLATRHMTAAKLRQYTDPRRRINLLWLSPAFGLVRFPGRGDNWGGPIEAGQGAPQQQIMIHVPRGIYESYALVDPPPTLNISAGSAGIGRVYSYTYPRVYPALPVAGVLNVTNLGTARVYPVLRIWGPVVNPIVQIGTSAGYWSLGSNGGVTLADGEYIDIDTFARSIVKNTGDIMFRYLDKSTVVWGWLEPLVNDVHYNGTSAGTNTHIDVLYRHGWR